jgi:hypothetical protein
LIFTSSPLKTDEVRAANAVLQSQLAAGGVLSTPLRDYAGRVIRRSERQQAQTTIIEEQQKILQTAVTKRKAILSGKRKSIDGKHILTKKELYLEIAEAERKTKKRKTTKGRKGKRTQSQIEETSRDVSEVSDDESLVVEDCIEVL